MKRLVLLVCSLAAAAAGDVTLEVDYAKFLERSDLVSPITCPPDKLTRASLLFVEDLGVGRKR